MATDFVQASNGRNGKNHSAYIAGEGRYADKNEVIFFEDGNLPQWAKSAVAFFAAADKHEAQARSGKGRSYRGLMIPIPHEAPDKVRWSKDFAREVCGTDHAFRLGVHALEGNPHLHLMFSERKTRHDLSPQDHFARGKNNKVREFTKDTWLEGVKNRMLENIQKLVPGYVRKSGRGEEKIGPKLKNAGASYEAARAAREAGVFKLREDEKALADLVREIERFKPENSDGEKKRGRALDRILSRPAPAPVRPVRVMENHRLTEQQRIRLARSQQAPAFAGSSVLDRIAARRQKETSAEFAAIERERREAAYEMEKNNSAMDGEMGTEAQDTAKKFRPRGMSR